MKQSYTKFGIQVKIKLAECGITQAEFCRTIGMNPARLSQMIHNDRCFPRLREKVCGILGIEKAA